MTFMKFADAQRNERKVLKTVYHLTMEDPERATFIQDVQQATGLPLKELQDHCKTLQKSGYIERTNFRIVMTDEGVTRAEKMIEQAL